MTRRFDQLLGGFADGDAISQEARCLQQLARAAGFAADIFCPPERVAPGMQNHFRPLHQFKACADDVVLYHHGVASPAGGVYRASPAQRLLRYHNITPPHFFDGFDDRVAAQLRAARAELPDILAVSRQVWAVSEFNAAEIRALGHAQTTVAPLFFERHEWDGRPDPATLAKFGNGMTNFLFVGRVAPNKGVEDLILAFAHYHGAIDANSRLLLVGSPASCPRYYAMLRMLSAQLRLANVGFEGFVSEAQLAAYYRTATVFVTASHHEGYCLPLLEAIYRGIPVLARATGGMPEALDGCGAMFEALEPAVLAELMHRVAADAELRRRMLASQALRGQSLRAWDMQSAFQALTGSLFP